MLKIDFIRKLFWLHSINRFICQLLNYHHQKSPAAASPFALSSSQKLFWSLEIKRISTMIMYYWTLNMVHFNNIIWQITGDIPRTKWSYSCKRTKLLITQRFKYPSTSFRDFFMIRWLSSSYRALQSLLKKDFFSIWYLHHQIHSNHHDGSCWYSKWIVGLLQLTIATMMMMTTVMIWMTGLLLAVICFMDHAEKFQFAHDHRY